MSVAELKSRSLVGVLILIGIFISLFILFSLYTLGQLKSSSESAVGGLLAGKSPIAVVEVSGVILKSQQTIELLLRAEKDPSVKAIILRVASPGGAVAPVQEIYHEVVRIDQSKPVYASFGSIAASGGYYIGAGTRKIFSNPGTLTGSIGVIMQFADLSKLYEFIKIDPYVVKSGKYKDISSPTRKMTGEERQLMAGLVANAHDQFRADIEARRKKKIVGSLIDHTQGQIFSGEQALKLGLVDELGSLWQAGRKIHEELKLEGEFGLRFIKPEKKFNLSDFVSNLEESAGKLNFALSRGLLPYYLYTK